MGTRVQLSDCLATLIMNCTDTLLGGDQIHDYDHVKRIFCDFLQNGAKEEAGSEVWFKISACFLVSV